MQVRPPSGKFYRQSGLTQAAGDVHFRQVDRAVASQAAFFAALLHDFTG
jgi:hypothetical protein